MPSKNSRLSRLQQALVFAERQYAEAFEREGWAQNPTDWIRQLTLDEEANLPPESDSDDFTWSAKQKDAYYVWEKMREQHEAVRCSPAAQRARKELDEARAAVGAGRARIEAARKREAAEEAEAARLKAKREAARKRAEEKRTAKTAEEALGNPASSEPRQQAQLKTGAKRGPKPFDWTPVEPKLSELYKQRGGPPRRGHPHPKWQTKTQLIEWVLSEINEERSETVVKIFIKDFETKRKNALPEG
jgi:hypothetical protein